MTLTSYSSCCSTGYKISLISINKQIIIQLSSPTSFSHTCHCGMLRRVSLAFSIEMSETEGEFSITQTPYSNLTPGVNLLQLSHRCVS